MNKTLSVNIGGFVFNIEEDAYEALRHYLDSIASFFNEQETRDEIIGDIEQRIAELFNERLGESRQVVVKEDVNAVIEIMGRPEQYVDVDEEDADNRQSSSDRAKSSNRRIYRDPDDAVLGGVAAGISHYLGWDPIALRIIFVLLSIMGLAGIPIYIILWIVIPEARTTAEKLRMKGEKINVENISKAVNEGAENIRSSFNSGKAKNGFEKVVSAFGSIVEFIAKLLRGVFGLAFLIAGAGMLVGLIIVVFGMASGSTPAHFVSIEFIREFIFFDDNMFILAVIAGALLFFVPIVAFLYIGVRFLLKVPSVKGFGITLIALFILGSILASIAGVNQGTEYSNDEEVERSFAIEHEGDTLYIVSAHDPYWHDQLKPKYMDRTELLKHVDDEIIFGYPRLRVQPTGDARFELNTRRGANGKSATAAIEHAESIEYHYEIKGDSLILDPFFSAPYEYRFRDQYLRLTLMVPEGKIIHVDESAARVIYGGLDGFDNVRSKDVPGKTFKHEEGNIICTSCEDPEEETEDTDRSSAVTS